jgi:oxygen-independent coproporphyrinogen-3 oxidase
MCRLCLNIPEFEKRFKISFWKHFAKEKNLLQEFVRDGLLEITDQKISVLEQGKLVIRNIAMIFDEYLEGIRTQAKDPVFSRTV